MKVFIWGMGLIGASLGLRLRQHGISVMGAVRSEKSLGVLQRMGFSSVTTRLEDNLSVLAKADVLAIGLNIRDCYRVIDAVMARPELRERLILFDMCSSKQQICDFMAKHYPDAAFVGCHPMAGKEKQGPEAADATLFEGSTVFLVPGEASVTIQQQKALSTVQEIWHLTGANTAVVGAEQHDHIMAYVSHGLHLAACLIAKLSGRIAIDSLAESPAAGSYRDMTRIVESSGQMWSEIIQSNSTHVAAWLRDFAAEATLLATQVENNHADIHGLFAEAKAARKRIMRK